MSAPLGAQEKRRQLIVALAAFAPVPYHNDPQFHARVHSLADLLPDMVLGLAEKRTRW